MEGLFARAAEPDLPRSSTRLLTRHFFRRCLDNDLISTNVDRHETLTASATLLISLGLFISVLLASKYVINPFPTPVAMAIGAMGDRSLLISGSLLVMALVAVAQWDALSIDARDAAILGPLPVDRGTIVRAKLASLVLCSSAFVLVMNAGPAVLFPLFFASQLPLGLPDIVTLILAHAVVTLAAGGFGVASVVLLREALRLLLGAHLFHRVSTPVQAILVAAVATALLLLPAYAPGLTRRALQEPTPSTRVLPPLWFVGLHEVIAGHVVTALPSKRVPRSIALRERNAAALYQRSMPRFRSWALDGLKAFGAVIGLALVLFVWNNRRLHQAPPIRPARRSRMRRLVAAGLERWLVPDPVSQAGFFFTVHVLPRSTSHRIAIAVATAAGNANLTLALAGVELTRMTLDTAPLGIWAAQTVFVMALVAGFRHAVRVPADFKASPSFVMAWGGEEQAYLAGVKRAGLVAVALPAVVVLAPLHVVLLGPGLALLHAVLGVLLAGAVLEASCAGLRQPAFVCAYQPLASMKRAMPMYAAGVLAGCYVFAAIERLAMTSAAGFAVLAASLVAALVLLRWRDAIARRHSVPLEIEAPPDGAMQRLDLSS